MPVGTVDKFQGQEAPVVFYSTTSSSGDEVPRGLEFLFSRNRLNVAISRAQCLAVLVGSPGCDVRTRSVEQMRLVNALCRFAELAEEQAAQPLVFADTSFQLQRTEMLQKSKTNAPPVIVGDVAVAEPAIKNRLRVLICDDDAGFVALRVTLATEPEPRSSAWRATVSRHSELAESLALLDVILLDIEMPRMDGIQTLAAFRKARQPAALVMLTGIEDHDVIGQARSSGRTGSSSSRSIRTRSPTGS